jgi:acyl-CoA synthetase (AMP-forming)/AMP-acid ligase II
MSDEFDLDRLSLSTIPAQLARRAAERPDAPFVTSVSAYGEVRVLTYGEADRLSDRVAAWVRSEVGAEAGQVLALAPVNDVDSIVTVIGLLRSGCPALLVSPTAPAERVREQCAALDVRAVLAVPDVTALPDRPFTAPDVRPDDDALYFGTSGSTAAAKLVAQTHRNTVANALGLGLHHRLRPADTLLGCLPIHHVNGLHFTVFGTLAAGAHLVLAHAFDPLRYPSLIERFRPRIASVVPAILEALVATWRDPQVPEEFEYFVTAAAPLAARTARAVVSKFGVRVLQGYGLTETTNFSTTIPPGLPEAVYRRLVLDAEIPTVGTAFPGNEVAVLTDNGERAEPGQIGEVCMRGLNVMDRYAAEDEASAYALRGGWFHSEDLGFETVDESTGLSFFVLTGRRKNIAKVGGETVSLDEMDRVLRAVPELADAACVALPHRFLGEQIVAAVVLDPGSDRPDLDSHLPAIDSHLQRYFAAAALPARIVSMEAIPRTPTGKVLRPQLAGQLATPEGQRGHDG